MVSALRGQALSNRKFCIETLVRSEAPAAEERNGHSTGVAVFGVVIAILWYARQDSNLRPLTPEASALSAELRAHECLESIARTTDTNNHRHPKAGAIET